MLKIDKLGNRSGTLSTSLRAENYAEVLKFCQERQFTTLSEFLRYAVLQTLQPREEKTKTKIKRKRKSIEELMAELDGEQSAVNL